jgi:hypothetical protein
VDFWQVRFNQNMAVEHNCIIVEDKNGGERKGYPNPDQTFQAEFNELLFISIALKPNRDSRLKYLNGIYRRSPRKFRGGPEVSFC